MSSAADNLEVITPAADKGVALGMLCRELGTDLDHAAAIGDSENDLEMLNAVASRLRWETQAQPSKICACARRSPTHRTA